MVDSTRSRRRSPAQFVAIGLPPGMVGKLMERLDEEGATPLRVEHDEEGTARVFFQLASWDSGTWIKSLAPSLGCGVAPCRAPA